MIMRKRKVIVLWSVLLIAALGALSFISMPKLSLWNDCVETKMKIKLPIKGLYYRLFKNESNHPKLPEEEEEINNIIYENTLRYQKALQLIKAKVSLTPYPAPLFPIHHYNIFPKESINHPFTYAKNLIKYRLSLEFENGIDLFYRKSKKVLKLKKLVDRQKLNPIYIDIKSKRGKSVKLGDAIDPSKAYHILLAATFRSGSTFLGELLSRYPGVFYTFEPLMYTNNTGVSAEKRQVNLLSQLFKCKPEFGYFIHGNQPKIRNFEYNFRLWNACRNIFVAGSACYMPELYYSICPIFPIRVIKTVRFRVEAAEQLLTDPDLNTTLKIVVLVRDPRGLMNSRWQRRWCKYDSCGNPTVACKDLHSDILAAYQLKKKFPDRIYLIRYEDMSIDPFGTIGQLFGFLELPEHKLVTKFIAEHTQGNAKKFHPHGTKRNSKSRISLWKKRLNSISIINIQNVCKEPMRILGYNPMTKVDMIENVDNFTTLVKSDREVWPTD